MKTCPVCHASTFDDAKVCYGCMHRFDDEVREGLSSGNGDFSQQDALRKEPPALSGLPIERCAAKQLDRSEGEKPYQGQSGLRQFRLEESAPKRCREDRPSSDRSKSMPTGPLPIKASCSDSASSAKCRPHAESVAADPANPHISDLSECRPHAGSVACDPVPSGDFAPSVFTIAFEPMRNAAGELSWRCTITPSVRPAAVCAPAV